MILLMFLACADITFSLQGGGFFSGETGADSGWDTAWDSGGGGWDSGWPWGGGDSGDSGGSGGWGDTDDSGAPVGASDGDYGDILTIPFSMGTVNFLRTGDLNGDGLVDVVVTGASMDGWTYGDRGITLGQAIQQTDGSFTVSETTLEETSGVRAIFDLGDVDGDGDDDIVLGHFTGFTTWLGGPDGLTRGDTVTKAWTSGVGLGDTDGDGDLDLAIMDNELEATTYENDGAGDFTERDSIALDWSYSGDFDYSDALLHDIDGDGNLDLLTLVPWNYGAAPSISAFLGDGAGDFDHTAMSPAEGVGGGTYQLPAGDFNGDDDQEIVLGSSWEDIQVLPWRDGGFDDPDTVGASTSGAHLFSTGDVDNDGDTDLLASRGFTVEMLEQDGAGLRTAGVLTVTDTLAGTVACDAVDLGDLNNDGCQDIVLASYPDGIMVVPYLCDAAEPEEEEEDDTDAEIPGEEYGDPDSGFDTGVPVRPKSTGLCATSPKSGLALSLFGLAAVFLRRRRLSD